MAKSAGDRLFLIVTYIIMCVVVFVCVYPFYYLVIYSISDPAKVYGKAFLMSIGFNLDAYIGIFKINYISNAALVSLARTTLGTVITVFCSSLFAYVLHQDKLPLKKLIYRYVVVTMYFNAGLIPWYMTMRMLGLRNNFFVYILPGAVSTFGVIMIRTYYRSLPASLEESAKLDGAGFIRTFINIVIPLSMPIIATISIMTALGQWNAWTDNYFLVSERKLRTLQLILYDYLMESSRMSKMTGEALLEMGATRKITVTPSSIKAAITIVVTTPVIFVYPYLQKHIRKGLMIGAVKG